MRRKQGKPYKFGNGGEVPGYADGGKLTPRAQQAVGMLMQGAAQNAQAGGAPMRRAGPPQGMPPQGMPPQGPPQGMPPQGMPVRRAPPAQAALAAGAAPAPRMAAGGSIDGVAKRGKTKCRSV